MLIYRCAHCGTELGMVPQDVEPTCPNHPNGVVEVIDDGDQES
jgi:hypothetical protein